MFLASVAMTPAAADPNKFKKTEQQCDQSPSPNPNCSGPKKKDNEPGFHPGVILFNTNLVIVSALTG
jgi:hypothetical protein